ncbi:MAG: hypothetical protein JO257_00780 [Deltaproteobacteria bacterium]|nr:hypothetical protein [Deltaproteobacteria bacterium]
MSGRIEVAGLAVIPENVPHPLLGEAHAIEHGGRVITHVSAIDWDHPARIPAIAEPGALPPHSGGALMNELARRATRPLRYAGPYPTPALYRTLLRSFRASADEAAFTKDLVRRAATLATDEIPIDFTPAPHTRVPNAHGHAELRDGLERAVIDGVAYEAGAVARIEGRHAEVWFGDEPWARVASFDGAGQLVDGPHAIPPPASDVVGKPFPPALLHALASLVGELVPLGLPVELPRVTWADLGARAARAAPAGSDGYEVHAALWERLAPQGMARLALALAEALAPVVTMRLVASLGNR